MEAEGEKQIGAHHEDRAENHVIGHVFGIVGQQRRQQPADISHDESGRTGKVERCGAGAPVQLDFQRQQG